MRSTIEITEIKDALRRYHNAKLKLLSIADVSGALPYPIEIWDGLKVDVTFKGGRLVIQKGNDH